MKRIRTVFFWTHLTAGLLAGVVILVMSFTGVVLALKPQILNWIERDVKYVAAVDGPKLGPRAILAAVKDARPDAVPASVTMDRNPETAAAVNIGTAGNVYVNPYTGAVTGNGSAKANQFFQSMTTWHRYMNFSGESRPLGKSITGASNLAFLFLGLTGLYIWWPKQLTLRHLRPITWFRASSTGRARDFNWHNTIGFWCLPAIIIMTLSATIISYPWANNLVYRLMGSPIPAAGGAGGGGGGRGAAPAPNGQAADARGGREAGPQAAREERAGREGRPERVEGNAGPREGERQAAAPRESAAQPAVTVVPAKLDEVWARAQEKVPTWSLITFRLPNRDGGAVSFTITDGAHWNQFARSTLTLNSATAEVVTWQPYEAGSRGQKVRGWLRFAHTGELGRLPGQVIAGIGCLGGVFLVYTGFSLAFRRLWNWSLWARLSGRQKVSELGSESVLSS